MDAWMVFSAAIGLVSGIATFRYGRRRIKEAEELRAKGLICVGFTFLGGPVMAPPWDKP